MPWAAIIPAVAALYADPFANKNVIPVTVGRPSYPEAAAPEYDPLMSSLLDLLAKDRESNSTD